MYNFVKPASEVHDEKDHEGNTDDNRDQLEESLDYITMHKVASK